MEQAMKVIEYYGDRWKIEEAHRLLKTKGFDIESTELESGTKIRKLLLLGMEASIKVMQLKAARSKESKMKLKAVFSTVEIKCMEKLNIDLEGKTDKQKNPFNKNSLSWGSWIIARLGGWKGYSSQRPAGTITFKRGLERYEEIFLGYKIALDLKDVYKR